MTYQERGLRKHVRPELPSGINDILLADAQIKSEVQSALAAEFRAWGFDEIVTPSFERYEMMVAGGLEPESMYTFTGSEGELLALRPDLTTPIARVVASRLRDVPRPIRLYYQGHVFRRPQYDRRQSVEFAQAGVELIGTQNASADAEIVALSIESLNRLGLDDYQINLGHIGVFQGILEGANLDPSTAFEIRQWVDRKDAAGLNRCLDGKPLDDKVSRRLLELLALSGHREVLAHARDIMACPSTLTALDNLEIIYETLVDFGLGDRIVLDLAEVRGLGYYTGMMFEGFSRSAPVRILNGGRYDSLIDQFGLDCPAVGCAFDLAQLRLIVQGKQLLKLRDVDTLVQYSTPRRNEAFVRAQALRNQGQRVELSVDGWTLKDATAYATSRKIRTILVIDENGERSIPVNSGTSGGERSGGRSET